MTPLPGMAPQAPSHEDIDRRPGTQALDTGERSPEARPAKGPGGVGNVRRSALPLAGLAIVACCGVKVLVLAAVAVSAGSLGVIVRNVAITVAALAVLVTLVAYAVWRRQCAYARGLPAAGQPGAHPDDDASRPPTSMSST